MRGKLFPFSGFGMLSWVISIVRKGSVIVPERKWRHFECLHFGMWYYMQIWPKFGQIFKNTVLKNGPKAKQNTFGRGQTTSTKRPIFTIWPQKSQLSNPVFGAPTSVAHNFFVRLVFYIPSNNSLTVAVCKCCMFKSTTRKHLYGLIKQIASLYKGPRLCCVHGPSACKKRRRRQGDHVIPNF